MKRALFTTLLFLSACDWQAAENKARCTAGELNFCSDGGATGGGSATGGGATGGGTATGGGNATGGGLVDAGRMDYLVPNGSTPFALEEGPGGMVWVITEQPGWSYVSSFANGTITLLGAFDAGFTASHADPLISPALLLTANNGAAGTGFPDGGSGPSVALPSPAALAIQFPTGDGGITASFWLKSPSVYVQYGSPAPILTTPTIVTAPIGCTNLSLHDITVVLADAGCCAVIGYSGACNGGNAAGIDGGSGIQVLAVDAVPYGIRLNNGTERVMVGRSAQGFDVATNTQPMVFRRYDRTATQQNNFALNATPGPLTLGDVSDGFMSVYAQGSFQVEGVNISVGAQSAMVVEPATSRVFALGTAQDTRLPILALNGRVLVLWKRSTGELVLTQLQR